MSLLALQHLTSELDAFQSNGSLKTKKIQSSSCLNAKSDSGIDGSLPFINRNDFLRKAALSSAAFAGSYLGYGPAFAEDETASSRPESLDIDNFLRTGT